MPPQDKIENLNEGDKSVAKDRPGDSLGEARTVDGKAVQQVQKKNRDMCTSMTDIPDWGTIGKAASNAGFCLTDGDQVVASKNVKEPNIYDASDQDHLLGGKETTFLGQKAIERNGNTYLDAHASNVPEVSQGVQSLDDVKALGTGIGHGLQHVGQETLNYLATPGAVENTLLQIGPALDNAVNYYANTPADQVARDAQAALGYAGQALEDTLGHPLKPEQRGEYEGVAMAAFFPIGANKALTEKELEALGGVQKLEQMTERELDTLGIRKVADDAGEAAPRRDLPSGKSERPPESRESPAEGERGKLAPSEAFRVELQRAIESLDPSEKAFLQDRNIKIESVRRIEDINPGMDRKTAGIYDPTEKAIYVPEEVWSNGEWRPNPDVMFELRHEFGHAYNATAHPFGDWISDRPAFREAFKADAAKLSPEQLDELRLSPKYRPSVAAARDEVFSDMYAHSTGFESNNPYSQKMKAAFPSCLRYLSEEL